MSIHEGNQNRSKQEIVAYGKPYRSIRHLAESHDIDSNVLYERIKTGVTPEEGVDMGFSKYSINAFGVKYKNALILSKHYDVDYHVLVKRISAGNEPEEVIMELLNKKEILFEGESYKNLIELCNKYGVQVTNVIKRMNGGWSLEDAVFKPIEGRVSSNPYKYKGVPYDSQRELTDAYGLSTDIVRTLSQRLEIEFVEALDILVVFLNQYKGARPKKISKLPFVIYDGVWIDTLKEFCAQIGIEFRRLNAFRRDYDVPKHYDALIKMKGHTIVRWIDNRSNEVTSQAKLIKRYSSDIKTLERKGIARKAEIKAYPALNFDSTLYFATPLMDFEEYLKEIAEEIQIVRRLFSGAAIIEND